MPTLYDELVAHRRNKHDKRVFGLILQGGGMRAVYSAGAVKTLTSYGLSDAFDHVIGSSAGAINAAYLLAGDGDAKNTYTDDLTNKNFVNLLRKEKKVDVDFLVDEVLTNRRSIDVAALNASPSKLHIIVTDAKTGKEVILSDHHRFSQIYEEFRATAALPLLYDKKISVFGQEYIDGAVANMLPIDIAKKLGCSDIVVILTQKLETYHFDKAHTHLVHHLVKRFAKNHTDAVRESLPTNERKLRANLRLIHPSSQRLSAVLT